MSIASDRKQKELKPGTEGYSGERQSSSHPWTPADGKTRTEFLWLYVSLVAVLIALLTFLLLPTARKRIQERLDIVFSNPPTTDPTTPVPPTLPASLLSTSTTLASLKSREATGAPIAEGRTASRIPRASERTRIPPLIRQTAELEEPASADTDSAADSAQRQPPRLGRSTPTSSGGQSSGAETTRSQTKDAAPKSETAISPMSQNAFKILLDKVPSMAALHGNTLTGMQFSSWKAVKEEDPEVWIALIGRRTADNQEESFIWKVNTSDLSVFPLSQAARRVAVQK